MTRNKKKISNMDYNKQQVKNAINIVGMGGNPVNVNELEQLNQDETVSFKIFDSFGKIVAEKSLDAPKGARSKNMFKNKEVKRFMHRRKMQKHIKDLKESKDIFREGKFAPIIVPQECKECRKKFKTEEELFEHLSEHGWERNCNEDSVVSFSRGPEIPETLAFIDSNGNIEYKIAFKRETTWFQKGEKVPSHSSKTTPIKIPKDCDFCVVNKVEFI